MKQTGIALTAETALMIATALTAASWKKPSVILRSRRSFVLIRLARACHVAAGPFALACSPSGGQGAPMVLPAPLSGKATAQSLMLRSMQPAYLWVLLKLALTR